MQGYPNQSASSEFPKNNSSPVRRRSMFLLPLVFGY